MGYITILLLSYRITKQNNTNIMLGNSILRPVTTNTNKYSILLHTYILFVHIQC